MKVNVLLFGRLTSIAGGKELSVRLEKDSCSVKEMMVSLFGVHPKLREETFRVVVNQSISHDDDMIEESDEVALLPPISGGNFTYLTRSPIITANWMANSANVWTVPIGGGERSCGSGSCR